MLGSGTELSSPKLGSDLGVKMIWREEQKKAILDNLMDVCANLDSMRQVVVLTVTDQGRLFVVKSRKDDATFFETYGMLKIAADSEISGVDLEYQERPNQEED